MSRDWVAWHRAYDDPQSPLVRRLDLVGEHLRRALAEAACGAGGVINLTTMCAGEGRDVLPVLAETGGRPVRATLIELDPRLVERARTAATELGLSEVEVRTADAGTPESYRDLPPANVLTVCGVFGNITIADVRQTIGALPGLLAPDGIVIWTRGVADTDHTPEIRATFAAHGFTELSFVGTADAVFRVGMHRLDAGVATDVGRGGAARMFTFRP